MKLTERDKAILVLATNAVVEIVQRQPSIVFVNPTRLNYILLGGILVNMPGITEEEFSSKLEPAGKVCAICQEFVHESLKAGHIEIKSTTDKQREEQQKKIDENVAHLNAYDVQQKE